MSGLDLAFLTGLTADLGSYNASSADLMAYFAATGAAGFNFAKDAGKVKQPKRKERPTTRFLKEGCEAIRNGSVIDFGTFPPDESRITRLFDAADAGVVARSLSLPFHGCMAFMARIPGPENPATPILLVMRGSAGDTLPQRIGIYRPHCLSVDDRVFSLPCILPLGLADIFLRDEVPPGVELAGYPSRTKDDGSIDEALSMHGAHAALRWTFVLLALCADERFPLRRVSAFGTLNKCRAAEDKPLSPPHWAVTSDACLREYLEITTSETAVETASHFGRRHEFFHFAGEA